MTSVQLKDLKGSAVGEVSFDDEIFGLEPNTHVMHQALLRQLANARAGTASTKTRSEVRGGGAKPWRQKGTGRARAGSIRSPLWHGGGVAFGPKPRDYSQSMPKKARQLALRSAIAAKKDQFVVVKSFDGLFKSAPKADADPKSIEQPKTKDMFSALKALGLGEKKVLLLLDSGVPGVLQIERSARNLPKVRILNVNNLNVKDILEADAVLTVERTVEALNLRFRKSHANAAPASSAKKEKAAAPKKEKAAGGEEKAAEKKPTKKAASAEKTADTKPAPKTRKKAEE